MKKDKILPKIQVEIFIEKDKNSYLAYCPVFKGLYTCGNTKEEALSNAIDAIIAYLESLIKHNEPIPIPSSILIKDKKLKRKISKKSFYKQDITIPACAPGWQ